MEEAASSGAVHVPQVLDASGVREQEVFQVRTGQVRRDHTRSVSEPESIGYNTNYNRPKKKAKEFDPEVVKSVEERLAKLKTSS